MKNILVAVDGSVYAQKALEIAIDLAKAHDASVSLIHVSSDRAPSREQRHLVEMEYSHELVSRVKWREPKNNSPKIFAQAAMTQHADITNAVSSILSEHIMSNARQHVHDAGVQKGVDVVEHGAIAENIIEIANAHDVDTIVIGTRGMSDLRGLVMGSVSHQVVHEAPCSVILVK